MPELSIREVGFGSAGYWQTVALRDLVLRRPMGMTLTDAERAGEESQRHVAAFDGDILAGCLILARLDDRRFKIRQVAVSPDRQNGGVGRRLVGWAENLARSLGATAVELHSRETVIGFYERLGYKSTGQPFIEVTIPHRKMEKSI